MLQSCMTKLTKILPTELQVGMYVSELDRPWLETPFLFQGFRIDSEHDIEQIRQVCRYVYIDELKSDLSAPLPRDRDREPPARCKRRSYDIRRAAEQELEVAHREYHAGLDSVAQMLQSIQHTTTFDSTLIRRHVKQCTQSIIRNPAAMMWLSRIKHADNYTAEHCLNVGILAISLGRHLGLEQHELEQLGLCGILHDVGKMLVDPEILHKTGALTPQEFEQIKQHPVHARSILETDPSLPGSVLEAAYSHHERIDGGGYPEALEASRLDLLTRIITVVDAYDAMTSNRCYSKARPVSEALKILYKNRDTQFDAEVTIKFIECIGIYPPGCIVEMDSGEVGFVINNNPQQRLLPRVALLLDSDKQPMTQHIHDLAGQGNNNPEGMHIRAVLPDGAHGLSLEEYTGANIRMQHQ